MRLGQLPYGVATFCDDIRQEVGNKFSLIGCYNDEMLLPYGTEFPAILAKLGVAVTWYEDRDAKHDKILFKVGMRRLDADPNADDEYSVGEALVDVGESRKMGIPEKLKGSPTVRGTAFSAMVFSPCVLQFPGLIRCRAFIAGEVWGLSGIRISVAPAPAQP